MKNNITASIKRGGQAREMILDARGNGLTEEAANHGLNRAANVSRGMLDSVRIIGDGFDITRRL